MIPKISDIFQQKLNEIQSRVPVKIKGSSEGVSFEKYLADAVSKTLQSLPQRHRNHPQPIRLKPAH